MLYSIVFICIFKLLYCYFLSINFLNIFDLQLVESTNAEPPDTKGWLYIQNILYYIHMYHTHIYMERYIYTYTHLYGFTTMNCLMELLWLAKQGQTCRKGESYSDWKPMGKLKIVVHMWAVGRTTQGMGEQLQIQLLAKSLSVGKAYVFKKCLPTA